MIGQTCLFRWPGGHLAFHVRIVEEKVSYGHHRARIEPVAGTGSRWIDAARLSPLTDPIMPEEDTP